MSNIAEFKMQTAVRHAREWSRDSWQLPTRRDRKLLRTLSREAIQDARYWRAKLNVKG